MDTRNHHTLIWVLISAGLLIPALLIFLLVGAGNAAPVPSGTAFDNATHGDARLLALGALFVTASALVAFGAVAARHRGLERGTRAPRVRSLDALVCLVAVVLMFATPALAFSGADPASPLAYTMRSAEAGLLVAPLGVLLIVLYIIFAIGALFAGLSDAAATGRRGWYVIMIAPWAALPIAIAVALLAGTGRLDLSPALVWVVAIVIGSPLLSPIVTLIYSFTTSHLMNGDVLRAA
jgi:hypothetical protein